MRNLLTMGHLTKRRHRYRRCCYSGSFLDQLGTMSWHCVVSIFGNRLEEALHGLRMAAL